MPRSSRSGATARSSPRSTPSATVPRRPRPRRSLPLPRDLRPRAARVADPPRRHRGGPDARPARLARRGRRRRHPRPGDRRDQFFFRDDPGSLLAAAGAGGPDPARAREAHGRRARGRGPVRRRRAVTLAEAWALEFRAALADYLQGSGETALARAYELGRKAIAENLTLLDVTALQ